MLETLKTLCNLNGTSGREEKIREYIIGRIKDICELRVDPMGNLIAFKKGKKTPKNRVMFSAHTDEVGFIITGVTDQGFLRFDTVGGIDKKVIAGRTVTVGESELRGVIGIKPVHLISSDEKGKVPDTDKMYIDIGAASKEEAEKYVSLGDAAYFVSEFEEMEGGVIKAKAIDDRFGCALMLKMIESEPEYDAYYAFLVQEEVGLRGGAAAVNFVKPDYAVVLEATTASDIASVGGADRVCCFGGGAVISFMDRSSVYNPRLFKGAFETAKKHNIKVQPKTAVAGGNDAGAIHKALCGVYTLTVSLPCRYIHSGTSCALKEDMQSCYKTATALLSEYADA